MKKNITKYLLALAILLLAILAFQSYAPPFGYDKEVTYTSPEGTYTIVIKYDYVSRPDVFTKGLLWDRMIWDYPNPGFMETVRFDVEWLSENQILLHNDAYDEEHIITILE